jgi:hypothetical protein
MRKISLFNILLLYFNRSPFIFGEALFIVGIIFIISMFPDLISLFGLIIISIGIILIRIKFLSTKKAVNILRNGKYVESELTHIGNAGYSHNKRTVQRFVFEYLVNEKKFYYQFKSAYHRRLSVGDEFLIYYLEKNPEQAVIPTLYSVYIYS